MIYYNWIQLLSSAFYRFNNETAWFLYRGKSEWKNMLLYSTIYEANY